MSDVIDPVLLREYLEADRDAVASAFEEVQRTLDPKTPLSFLEPMRPGMPALEESLSEFLEVFVLSRTFLIRLRSRTMLAEENRRIAEVHAAPNGAAQGFGNFAPPPPVTVGAEESERFARDRESLMCNVHVAGAFKGMGTFLSRRLVLTPYHVIVDALGTGDMGEREITVEPASGGRFRATVEADPLETHDIEFQRPLQLVDLPLLQGFPDVALLRLRQTLLGEITPVELPDRPVQWQGYRNAIFLRKIERTADVVVLPVLSPATDAPRVFHGLETQQGLSGTPLFDLGDNYRFLGFHQGRAFDQGRAVPYSAFHAEEKFSSKVERDRVLPTLWSTNRAISGDLIIARQRLFDAVNTILDGHAPHLKGIWVRRLHTDRDDTGLGFTFTILAALLKERGLDLPLYRVAVNLSIGDLYDEISQTVLGSAAPGANSGARADESTRTAENRDRATVLVRRLEEHLDSREGPAWLYFDHPRVEVSKFVQIQYEQLVGELLRSDTLRFVIAGSELFDLTDRVFRSLDVAATEERPWVFVEQLGEFTRDDVSRTVELMNRDTGAKWTRREMDGIVDRAIAGLPVEGADRIHYRHLAEVARELKSELKRSLS